MKNRIKEYRVMNNLTQSELAKKVGVSRETIVRIENNYQDLSLKLALKIANCLNAPIERLFTDEIEEKR